MTILGSLDSSAAGQIITTLDSRGFPIHSISAANSTTAPLGAAATFTGAWEDVTAYTVIGVALLGSIATDGTLYFDLSTDGGTTSTSVPSSVSDTTFAVPRLLNVVETHCRIRYVNGTTAMTGTFSLQTKYSNGQPMALLSSVGGTVRDETPTQVVKSIVAGILPDGTYHNAKHGGTLFATAATLLAAASFDSGLKTLKGYQQVQTTVDSDVDGTVDFEFYSDSAGSVLVRTLSFPYDSLLGFQLYSAPAFTDYVKYKYTNGSVNQATFHYETKSLTTSVSGQLLNMTAPVASGMVANLGRNVIVGLDADGVYRNVRTTRNAAIETTLTDSDLGFPAIVTPGGGLKTNESTHLVGEAFGTVALNATKWSIDLVGTGAQDATGNGQLSMTTGTTANSAVEIDSVDVARFIPANYNTTHQAVTIPDGASYAANNSRKWGAFDATNAAGANGIYFELDSGDWYVVHCLNGASTRVIQASWNGAGATSFPTNSIAANVFECEYNAGSIIFRVNGNVIHRFNLTNTPYANNINFPVGMSNTNKNGSTTDVTLNLRAAAIYTLGKGAGVDRPFYISGTDTGTVIKTGPGHLGKVILSRTGSGLADATVEIYDALSATNQIGRIAIGGDDVKSVDYDLTFNTGLYIVVAGAGTLGTTITFD